MRKVPCDPAVVGETAVRLLAARCDGFSGADLQALLYNAQLAAIHEVIGGPGRHLGGGHGGSAEAPPLTASQEQRVRASLDPACAWLQQGTDEQGAEATHGAGAVTGAAGDASPTGQPPVRIEQRHLDDALDTTSASISPSELYDRDLAFKRFGEPGSADAAPEGEGGGGKSVLRALRAVHM